jgi:CPA1 family monovalent cation:H+ antiporter
MGLTEYHLFEDIGRYRDIAGYVIVAFLLTIGARILVVYGLAPVTNKLAPSAQVTSSDKAVMLWGGLRGAIPLALALGLPAEFEHRIIIIDLTLGTVLLSLIIQGTTIRPLLKKLKIV